MIEYRTDWGRFEITLAEYLKDNNISKSSLSKAADLQYIQLQSYCKDKIQRPDLAVLARIDFTLECDLSDIIKYIPPEKQE